MSDDKPKTYRRYQHCAGQPGKLKYTDVYHVPHRPYLDSRPISDIDQVEAIIANYLLPAIKGLPALRVNQEAFMELKERFDPVDLCSLLDTKVLVIQELITREEQEKLFDDAEVD